MKIIDRHDIVIATGLLCIAGGVALLSVPIAFIVLGTILLLMGLTGLIRRGAS